MGRKSPWQREVEWMRGRVGSLPKATPLEQQATAMSFSRLNKFRTVWDEQFALFGSIERFCPVCREETKQVKLYDGVWYCRVGHCWPIPRKGFIRRRVGSVLSACRRLYARKGASD